MCFFFVLFCFFSHRSSLDISRPQGSAETNIWQNLPLLCAWVFMDSMLGLWGS